MFVNISLVSFWLRSSYDWRRGSVLDKISAMQKVINRIKIGVCMWPHLTSWQARIGMIFWVAGATEAAAAVINWRAGGKGRRD